MRQNMAANSARERDIPKQVSLDGWWWKQPYTDTHSTKTAAIPHLAKIVCHLNPGNGHADLFKIHRSSRPQLVYYLQSNSRWVTPQFSLSVSLSEAHTPRTYVRTCTHTRIYHTRWPHTNNHTQTQTCIQRTRTYANAQAHMDSTCRQK